MVCVAELREPLQPGRKPGMPDRADALRNGYVLGSPLVVTRYGHHDIVRTGLTAYFTEGERGGIHVITVAHDQH